MFGLTSARQMAPGRPPRRQDDRIVLHFDYDCFYAACFEVEDPELRKVPLAVQQKQIIVTCNYEARRRGLYKLQLTVEARKACPDVVIILGEDLTRFRNHSKDLYQFVRRKIWSGRAERLGFDEVWLDVTDMIDYNVPLVNHTSPETSWFCTDKEDPTRGFEFNALGVKGDCFPSDAREAFGAGHDERLSPRLILASHLASWLREALETEKGFTSTVGISTNKELSKLAGNLHKPRAQTTLMPPYASSSDSAGNVLDFLDSHEIGKIPGIGHRGADLLRRLVKGHDVGYKEGLVTKFTNEKVTVRDVRTYPGMGPDVLEEALSGPGTPRGFGGRAWDLLHGVDNSEVGKAADIPKQISIEDTYLGLSDTRKIRQKLILLSISLIRRLRVDLTEHDSDASGNDDDGEERDMEDVAVAGKPSAARVRRWMAHPRTLRLSTRERKPQRSFARVSRSGPMPKYVFDLQSPLEAIATRLSDDALLPMFTKMVTAKAGFDVFLLNVAATNMQETAGDRRGAGGKDIGKMFRTQDKVLSEWRVPDCDVAPDDDGGSSSGSNAPLQDTTAVSRLMAGAATVAPAAAQQAPYIGHDVSDELDLARKHLPPSVVKRPTPANGADALVDAATGAGSEDAWPAASQASVRTDDGAAWNSEGDVDGEGGHAASYVFGHGERCSVCGAVMPSFAMEAHLRFHREPD